MTGTLDNHGTKYTFTDGDYKQVQRSILMMKSMVRGLTPTQRYLLSACNSDEYEADWKVDFPGFDEDEQYTLEDELRLKLVSGWA